VESLIFILWVYVAVLINMVSDAVVYVFLCVAVH